MKKQTLTALVLIMLATLLAAPQALADNELAILRYCTEKYPEKGEPFNQCIISKRLVVAEYERDQLAQQLAQAQEELATLTAQLQSGREMDEEVIAELSRLSELVGELQSQVASYEEERESAPEQPVQAAPQPQQTAPVHAGGVVTVTTGVSYRQGRRPALVSVYPIDADPEVVNISALTHKNTYYKCGGAPGRLVMVTNHGLPMAVTAPEGMPSGFVEVYVDLNGDGVSDGSRKVIDPSVHGDINITWHEGDDIRFTYLKNSGEVLLVPGLPPQTLWEIPSSGVKGCELDDPRRDRELVRAADEQSLRLYDGVWPVR